MSGGLWPAPYIELENDQSKLFGSCEQPTRQLMIVDADRLLTDLGMPTKSTKIIVQRSGHLVVKAETNEGLVILKAATESEAMAPDARNAERLASEGLPVPEVLAKGEEPLSFVVLRWIEGESLNSASPLRAQREAGALLRKIHSIDNSGELENGQTWDEWMKGWLNVALPWWGVHDGVDSAMVDSAWLAFNELRPVLATRGSQFMLFDGRPDHFLVKGSQIVGIIDLHDAKPGDGGMDLGVMGVLDEELMKNVRSGYECNKHESNILDRLVPFYVFLRRLAAAEWHGRFGPRKVSEAALRLSIETPLILR